MKRIGFRDPLRIRQLWVGYGLKSPILLSYQQQLPYLVVAFGLAPGTEFTVSRCPRSNSLRPKQPGKKIMEKLL